MHLKALNIFFALLCVNAFGAPAVPMFSGGPTTPLPPTNYNVRHLIFSHLIFY